MVDYYVDVTFELAWEEDHEPDGVWMLKWLILV
jgi:hypothetical protein